MSKEKEQARIDKTKINILIQRSGKLFTEQEIKEIKIFLDCKGNFIKVAEKLNIDLDKF